MDHLFWRRCAVGALATAVVVAMVAASHSVRDGASAAQVATARSLTVPALPPAATPGAALPTFPAPALVATPSPSPAAVRSSAPAADLRGTGRLVTVPGESATVGTGPFRRYVVQVETGLGVDAAGFAAAAQRTLGDRRSWGRDVSFRRVATGSHAFTVVLASPALTDRLCAPLRTNGSLSCFHNGRAVINVRRWLRGATSYAGQLAAYREYVISHEVGHALGHGHQFSCRADGLAPVMMQQTKSLYGCRANPWPYP